MAHFNGEEYRVGHGVYLKSDAFKFGSSLIRIKKEKREKVTSTQIVLYFASFNSAPLFSIHIQNVDVYNDGI